ncbi:MAG: 4a-hydroxytetrahydrobiopterin dehydratase [Saprospiraceae bacterium]
MWINSDNKLQRKLVFKDFMQAMDFINRMATIAEKLNHHPNFSNSWNKVNIEITTHSAGNVVTEKDFQLAEEIDKILLSMKIS